MFGSGFALALSVLSVYFRDMSYLWAILLQVWFFATPIVYPPALLEAQAPDWMQNILKFNPINGFVEVYRRCLYDAGGAGLADHARAHALCPFSRSRSAGRSSGASCAACPKRSDPIDRGHRQKPGQSWQTLALVEPTLLDGRVEAAQRTVPDDPELTLLVPLVDTADPEVSIVVPALNEEITIEEFVQWCREGLADAGRRRRDPHRRQLDRRHPASAPWPPALACCARPSAVSAGPTSTPSRSSGAVTSSWATPTARTTSAS